VLIIQPVQCINPGNPSQAILPSSSCWPCAKQFFVFFRQIWTRTEAVGQGRIQGSLRKPVVQGWGWWYRKYAPGDTVPEGLEKEAREAKKGLRADSHTHAAVGVAAGSVAVKMKARPLGMPSLRFINTMRILIAPREAV